MNTPTVKVIDERSVHQICSGQVVVTIATAVKELVENSLDAGATSIEVRLKNWGADSLEVVDNGSGVLAENFAALALKHHTSKLNVFADLVGVETFGFRGEALSSLCALGNLSITTCHNSQDIGTRIEYDHDGHITKQQATARTHGTTVTLQNLFSTLPVRHKEFLRNIKREYTKMMQVLQGYCVISTNARISCYTIGEKGKKSLALATHGNSDMRENISNVFGPKQLQTLLEFKQINPTAEDCGELGLDLSQLDSNPVFSLTGFVSRCDHGTGRSANDRQYIFINKRPCDMPKVTRLVNEVYHVFNRNQYPFLVLNIDLSKDLVDVNVTPDKRQVFLQQEKLLFATIKSSLKAMYDPGTSNYETNQKPFTQIKLPFTKRKNNEEMNATAFSKSIKDRLLLAAKVSKNREGSSILKFTTKVSEPVEDKLDNISEVKAGDAIGPTEITLDSEILAASRDGLVNVSGVANAHKEGDLLTESINEEHEKVFTTKIVPSRSPSTIDDGHLPLNPNEYDLSSTERNDREDTIDELGSERSKNHCNKSTLPSLQQYHCTEHPGSNSTVTNDHLTHSPEQNRVCLSARPSVPRDTPRQLVSEDKELSKDELITVGKYANFVGCVNKNVECNINVNEDLESAQKQENRELEESARSENGSEVLEVENPYESKTPYETVNMHGKYSRDTRDLKRRRRDEVSEIQCNTKKVRLDEGYENDFERNTRKSIALNFDLQKLREKLTSENGSKTHTSETEGNSVCSRTFRTTIAPENNQRAEEELQKHIAKEMFSKMEIIGQFNQGFIITKLGDDLFIIDQHASDEKFNFEDQQKNTVLKSQRLICPQSLDLTAVNESVLMENLEVFRKNGFDFEIDEKAPVSQRVKLVSLPVSRNWSFGKSDVDELIFMLSDSPGVNYRPSNIRKMFASRACRMSVMVGTALNDGQMRRIIGHMGEMDHPWNCPHGRPTMRHLINLNMVRK